MSDDTRGSMARALGPLALLGAVLPAIACGSGSSPASSTPDGSSVEGGATSTGPDGGPPVDLDGGSRPDVADAPVGDAALPGVDSGGCGDTSSDPHQCGACGHDCGGTACTQGVCAPVLAIQTTTYASPIAVDGSNVYFIGAHSTTDGLFLVPKTGGDQTLMAAPPASTVTWAGQNLLVDKGVVYWTAGDHLSILSAPVSLRNGKATVVYDDPNQQGIATSNLAIANGAAYFAGGCGGLLRVPLPSGTATPVYNVPGCDGVAFVIDATGTYAYVATSGAILRATLGDGSLTKAFTSPSPGPVAIDGNTLFWLDQSSGAIVQGDVTTGSSSTLASGLAAGAYSNGVGPLLMVDATSVYLVTHDATASPAVGTVYRVPRAGGAPLLLARQQAQLYSGIAQDATSIFLDDSQQYIDVLRK